MRPLVTVPAAIVLVAAAGDALAQETQPAPAVVVDRAEGLPEWEKLYAVFSHPRCANCHVEDDRPRWSGPEFPAARVHGFNVQRGVDGSGIGNPGLRCTTCHFKTNSSVVHGPPGVVDKKGVLKWQLAPAEMAWFDKSSAEICAQVKDLKRNGNRSLARMATHVLDDELVGWGWDPGPGRQPAPGSARETYDTILNWASAGAQCP
jgi:hypothetical protein